MSKWDDVSFIVAGQSERRLGVFSKDNLKGGPGRDHCDGGGAIDKASGCEAERSIP
jgi:hypothetical protein